MKIYAISDLHLSINNPKPMDIFGYSWLNYLDTVRQSLADATEEDLILISGDISWAMTLNDAVQDLEYVSSLCKGKKIIIRGNHDYWWKSISAVRAVLPSDVCALQNDAVRFGNTVIAGSRGWVCDNDPQNVKIYQRELIRMELSLSSANSLRRDGDKLVVMTHYPPFNAKGESSPMTRLLSMNCADAVVYGHLHGTTSRAMRMLSVDGVPFYLTSCDLIANKAVALDI